MSYDLQPKIDTISEDDNIDTDASLDDTSEDSAAQLKGDDSGDETSKLAEHQKQERVSESVVRDVLHDVIRASAEMSDRSTETTDSEMDITIDRIDINPLELKAEYNNVSKSENSYADNEEADVELEIIEEKLTRKRNQPEDTYKRAKKIPKEETDSISEKHPGVFIGSETPPQIIDLPKLRSKKSETELNKAILDSLPVIEKLRAISRTGSVKDDASVSGGAQSEAGDNMSDKDSVASGMVTRNLRRKESRKPPAKSTSKSKKSGLNTRSSKGKGRRNIFKKKPVKSLTATATPVTADKVYFKGQYFHVGDIVSVTNVNDDDIYYAQLKGFLIDEYSDKSAVITWLLPTTASPPPNEGFHPATYIVGPEEELPRKLEVFTFVMHAPDDYFYNRRAPYRTESRPADTNFRSVRLGPRLRKTVDNKDVYVGIYC